MDGHSSRVGRERILDVAEKLFTEKGYRAASIREIARECGVTNAALYYHFPDKETLFFEVINRHAERLRRRMEDAAEKADSPREKTVAVLSSYTHSVMGQRAPVFFMRREVGHFKTKKMFSFITSLMKTTLAPLADALRLAKEEAGVDAPPDEYESASMLVGMLHGLSQQRRAKSETSSLSEEDIRMVVRVFFDGFLSDDGLGS
jgi:AcrR family transcriptional regulator